MKVLISIISHAGGKAWREAIRETWLKGQNVDYRFVLGNGAQVECADELLVEAPDEYDGIIHKVRAVCAWAVNQGYDYLFNCFTDTYVNVPRLMASGFEAHKYSGHFTHHLKEAQDIPLIADRLGRFDYASGGAGYWLEREVFQLVSRTEPPADIPWDDLWIGWLLGLNGIGGFHDPRYGFKGAHLYTPEQITVHLSQGTGIYDPAWMHRAHSASL